MWKPLLIRLVGFVAIGVSALVFATCPIGCSEAPSKAPVAGAPKNKIAIPEALQPILKAEKVTLFSIDGNEYLNPRNRPQTAEFFRGYPSLGKLELTDPMVREEVADSLAAALNRGQIAKCFWPRHGIRARDGEHLTDYVICFECGQMQVWPRGEPTTCLVDWGPASVLNKLLGNAGVPLAPEHGDKEEPKK